MSYLGLDASRFKQFILSSDVVWLAGSRLLSHYWSPGNWPGMISHDNSPKIVACPPAPPSLRRVDNTLFLQLRCSSADVQLIIHLRALPPWGRRMASLFMKVKEEIGFTAFVCCLGRKQRSGVSHHNGMLTSADSEIHPGLLSVLLGGKQTEK